MAKDNLGFDANGAAVVTKRDVLLVSAEKAKKEQEVFYLLSWSENTMCLYRTETVYKYTDKLRLPFLVYGGKGNGGEAGMGVGVGEWSVLSRPRRREGQNTLVLQIY